MPNKSPGNKRVSTLRPSKSGKKREISPIKSPGSSPKLTEIYGILSVICPGKTYYTKKGRLVYYSSHLSNLHLVVLTVDTYGHKLVLTTTYPSAHNQERFDIEDDITLITGKILDLILEIEDLPIE